jgi:hypothetical protein
MTPRTLILLLCVLILATGILIATLMINWSRAVYGLFGESVETAEAIGTPRSLAPKALPLAMQAQKDAQLTKMNTWRDKKQGKTSKNPIDVGDMPVFFHTMQMEIDRCGFTTDFTWDHNDGKIDELFAIGDYLEQCGT